MRTLIDTGVWSLALRRKRKVVLPWDQEKALTQLTLAIKDGQVVMVGPIRQEILSGIRDKTQFKKILGLLEPFQDEAILTDDYIEAARLFNVCRDGGIECGAVDMLLCASARRLPCKLLSLDRALNRCVAALQSCRELPRY